MNIPWKALAPVVVAIIIALIPAPAGLPQFAWYYFAIFVGVIVGLMFEPLPGGAIGLHRRRAGDGAVPYVFFSPEQLAKAGFSSTRASSQLGALRILQQHGVVDLRRVHVRARLREDRTGTPHRAAARQGDGPQDAHAGLRRDDRGLAPRALHAVQHGSQRRHDLPRDPQPAGALRVQAERPVHAAHGLLPHVGRACGNLRDELDVPHRTRAQPARRRAGEEDREDRVRVGPVVHGLRARRDSVAGAGARCSSTGSIRRR